MICCARKPVETTTQDDPAPMFGCPECGKQGPASAFAEPEPEEPVCTRVKRFRWWLAERLDALAAFVAPKF